jgi:phosphatidylglycerol:prolipoprotein diacylglycerol transferase
MFLIPYPAIDPVAVSLGPFVIRWYALAYIAGLLIGWRYCLALAKKPPHVARPQDLDDFLVWATLGVVLGGRTGYVLFYRPEYYFANPSEILKVWHGGMSFHGGALGVCIAIILFCRQRKMAMLGLADIIACAVPIGLFFGRIANFINGELWGRITDVSWAMIFPTGALPVADVPPQYRALCRPVGLLSGPGLNCPRYPSELMEATMEGIILFTILYLLQRSDRVRARQGALTACFMMGYAVARIVGEEFRQPDANLGFLFYGATMGQLLSIPLFLLGLALFWYAWRKPQPQPR